MKIFALCFSLFISLNIFAQTREELLEEFMKERDKMMRDIMKMFQDDFNNDSFFNDDMDPFSGFEHFKGRSGGVEIEEKYEKDGSLSIIITPLNENMDLDIKTNDEQITISYKVREEKETKKGDQSFKSFSSSSSTRVIPIPQGYKAKSPEAYGEKGIKISLIPTDKTKSIMSSKPSSKSKLKKSKSQDKPVDKKPIGKRPGEDTL